MIGGITLAKAGSVDPEIGACWGLGCYASILGYLVLAKIAFHIVNFVYVHFLRPGKNLKKECGEWAVVTGATDGIGKAMAIELSKRGQKVLLISRTPEKLKEAAAECKTETDTLALDFSGDWTDAKAESVKKALANKEIGVLVNNVGISYDHCEFFDALPADRVKALIDMNVVSTVQMTRAVLPAMLAQKKGAVVNMSSASSEMSCPLLAEYAAAKKFVTSFAESLDAEYKSKGLSFQSQTPMWVTSKLSKVRKATVTTPNPTTFAKCAVNAIGYERNISPYWVHDIVTAFGRNAPLMLVDPVMNMMHHAVRKAAHKKKERLAKEGKQQ